MADRDLYSLFAIRYSPNPADKRREISVSLHKARTPGGNIMRRRIQTRRRFLATTAASAALVAMPFVRGSYAAGKLSVGCWAHWVRGANTAMTEICQAWAAKEKVDLTIDYISTQGNKLLLTIAVEAQAKSGHDIMDFSAWEPTQHAAVLEPVDDIVGEALARNGPVDAVVEYLAKPKGRWLVVPGIRGSLLLCTCTRFDLLQEHAGIDIRAMYPAGSEPS